MGIPSIGIAADFPPDIKAPSSFSISTDLPAHSNRARDLNVTRMILSDLSSDPELSVYARKIKVVTHRGAVSLKGAVQNAIEKYRVEKIARKHASGMPIEGDLLTLAIKKRRSSNENWQQSSLWNLR